MFGSLGAPELIIIGLIIVLLFGVGKLSGLGKDLGSSVKEFRKAIKDEKPPEQQETQVYVPPTQQQYVAPPPPPQQAYVPPAQPQQPQYTPPPPQQQGDHTQDKPIF